MVAIPVKMRCFKRKFHCGIMENFTSGEMKFSIYIVPPGKMRCSRET